jgi:hypothetical protein
VAEAAVAFRAAPAGAKLDEEWSANIEADYKRRGGNK